LVIGTKGEGGTKGPLNSKHSVGAKQLKGTENKKDKKSLDSGNGPQLSSALKKGIGKYKEIKVLGSNEQSPWGHGKTVLRAVDSAKDQN